MGSKPPPAEDAKPTAGERSDTDVEHLTQDDLTVDLLQAEETPAVQERPRFAPAEMPSRSPASSPPPRWSQVWARVARSAESSSEISSVELPVESGTSSITTDRAVGVALQHTESARAGGFAWVSGGIALAALLPLPWLGGVPAEKIACALALTAIIAVSIWVRQRARRAKSAVHARL